MFLIRVGSLVNSSFNRTRMELKRMYVCILETRASTFNRTRMELKQGHNKDLQQYRETFNRTRMELKLVFW